MKLTWTRETFDCGFISVYKSKLTCMCLTLPENTREFVVWFYSVAQVKFACSISYSINILLFCHSYTGLSYVHT